MGGGRGGGEAGAYALVDLVLDVEGADLAERGAGSAGSEAESHGDRCRRDEWCSDTVEGWRSDERFHPHTRTRTGVCKLGNTQWSVWARDTGYSAGRVGEKRKPVSFPSTCGRHPPRTVETMASWRMAYRRHSHPSSSFVLYTATC
jgi:hypothetical protein